VVIVVGADVLVGGAAGAGRSVGVSDAIVGLTIVAIGTSAPELVTTLLSTLRGDRDIAVGNLLGSSVYNWRSFSDSRFCSLRPWLKCLPTVLIDLPLIWMSQKPSRSPVRTRMPFSES